MLIAFKKLGTIDFFIKNNKFFYKKERALKDEDIQQGRYEYLNNELIAIFSYKNKNYLYLKDKLVEITPEIKFEYYCEKEEDEDKSWEKYEKKESSDEKSWIKVYKKDKLIYKLEYKNGRPPFFDVLYSNEYDGPDWEIVNFAYYIGKNFESLEKNPDKILFPAGEEKGIIEKIKIFLKK